MVRILLEISYHSTFFSHYSSCSMHFVLTLKSKLDGHEKERLIVCLSTIVNLLRRKNIIIIIIRQFGQISFMLFVLFTQFFYRMNARIFIDNCCFTTKERQQAEKFLFILAGILMSARLFYSRKRMSIVRIKIREFILLDRLLLPTPEFMITSYVPFTLNSISCFAFKFVFVSRAVMLR